MSQCALIDEIVERVKRSEPDRPLYAKRTPMPPGTVVDPGQSPAEPDEDSVKYFRWFVGSALYLTQTRPDISYCVADLSRVVQNPAPQHLEIARHLAGYLMNTRSMSLKYGKPTESNELNKLSAFSDSSFADCPETRRSQSGVIICLNGSPVWWRSKRASLVALSSTEAEYVALGLVCKEVRWFTMAMEELGFPQLEPCGVRVCVDNVAAIKIGEGTQSRERSKHFALRYHYCREQVHSGYIRWEYVNTHLNPSDLLTKALSQPKHHQHASMLLGQPLVYDKVTSADGREAAALVSA